MGGHLSAGAAAVSPDDFSGGKIWIKADGTLTKDVSDNVSALGETHSPWIQVANAVTAEQPTWLSDGGGGLNAISFDGFDDVMASAALTVSGGLSLFVVGHTSQSAIYVVHGNAGTSYSYLWAEGASLMRGDYSRGPASRSTKNATVAGAIGADYHLWEQHYVATHASNALWRDGVDLVTVDLNTNDPSADETDVLTLGAWAGGSTLWVDGHVRELILYSPALSTDDAASIRTYLNSRWSIY